MTSGIGFAEIFLVLVIIIIFVKPKDIPKLMRKSFKLFGQLRTAVKKFMDDIDVD